MAGKPFQFGLASLVWLVAVSAVILGTFRYIRSASTEFFLIVLLIAMFAGPVIWLFTRPNPFRGRPRRVHTVPEEPPAPLDQRLQQFMSNVTPTEPSPTAGPPEALLPTSSEGKAARERGEIGQLLRRIHGEESSDSSRKS